MTLFYYIVFLVLNFFIGALCIDEAIKKFKANKYFGFGLEILVAFSCACHIAKYVFI